MKTKSIRIPDDLLSAVKLVEKSEKIEEATAMRKLMRIGFETYVASLYKEGKVTLGEAADFLKMNQMEVLDLFLDLGIKGNLEASDIVKSLERFVTR